MLPLFKAASRSFSQSSTLRSETSTASPSATKKNGKRRPSQLLGIPLLPKIVERLSNCSDSLRSVWETLSEITRNTIRSEIHAACATVVSIGWPLRRKRPPTGVVAESLMVPVPAAGGGAAIEHSMGVVRGTVRRNARLRGSDGALFVSFPALKAFTAARWRLRASRDDGFRTDPSRMRPVSMLPARSRRSGGARHADDRALTPANAPDPERRLGRQVEPRFPVDTPNPRIREG